MSDTSRREFAKKSLLLALGPVAAENAFFSSSLPAVPAQPQGGGSEFFEGFKREQIKTTGATINVRYGGTGSPALLLHSIPETHVLSRHMDPVLVHNCTRINAGLLCYSHT